MGARMEGVRSRRWDGRWRRWNCSTKAGDDENGGDNGEDGEYTSKGEQNVFCGGLQHIKEGNNKL